MTLCRSWVTAGMVVVVVITAGCRPKAVTSPSNAHSTVLPRKAPQSAARPRRASTTARPCLLFGVGYSFFLTEPKGWSMSCGKQAPPDKAAVLVHKREPPRPPKPWVIMYVVTLPRKLDVTSSSFLKALAEEKTRQIRGLSVAQRAPMTTGDGRTALVRLWKHPTRRMFELSAYVFHQKVVTVLALYARDQALIKRYRNDFHKLIRSYRFLSENIKI